jgi:Flp pilus assembly protein CpaB
VENITSSKLFTTRQGTIMLGVIAAVIAAIALIVYLNHYRNSVKGGNATISVLVAQVALADISPGQQLTAADFGPAGSSVANQLNPNQRAVVVPLGSPQEVGGQIGVGSHVDVWVTTSGQGSNGVSRPIAKLLFQNMYVLNAGTSGGNVTLRATPTQAGQLIYASSNTQIWLVLRPTIGTMPKPPVISAGSVTGG